MAPDANVASPSSSKKVKASPQDSKADVKAARATKAKPEQSSPQASKKITKSAQVGTRTVLCGSLCHSSVGIQRKPTSCSLRDAYTVGPCTPTHRKLQQGVVQPLKYHQHQLALILPRQGVAAAVHMLTMAAPLIAIQAVWILVVFQLGLVMAELLLREW